MQWLLCIFLVMLAAENSEAADPGSMKLAMQAYQKIQNKTVQFPCQEGAYFFFKAEGFFSEDDSDEEREEKVLEAQFEAVEAFISRAVDSVYLENSPFSTRMTRFLMPLASFQMENIPVTCVRESVTKDEFHQIVACESNAVNALKKKYCAEAGKSKNWTDDQWADRLADSYRMLETDKERRYFLSMLGCPLIAYAGTRRISYSMMDWDDYIVKGWTEIRTMLQWPFTQHADFPPAVLSELWQWVWCTGGEVSFAGCPSRDQGQLQTAKLLFHQGKDIPKIAGSLCDSLSVAPFSQETWRYLALILRVKRYDREAVMAYLQSRMLGNFSIQDIKNLQDLCVRCSMPVNARGLYWYYLILKKNAG